MSSSLDPHHASTAYLEATFTGPRQELSDMASGLLHGTIGHLAITGRSGSGKSHAAELVVRELGARGWRVARVLDPCRSLGSLADLLAHVVATEIDTLGTLGTADDAAETEAPDADLSVAALEARYRDTGTPLALVLDNLPALLERAVRTPREIRRLARLLESPGISVIATSERSHLASSAKSLAPLFHELELPALSTELAERLLERQAAHATGEIHDSAALVARALLPLVGRNPRTLVQLYQLASQGESDERLLMLTLVHRMSPYFRRELDLLSPQQGMVVARLALAPGPIAAARLGRRCGLPTSHTTAILDVLLQRRLVARVPGPGKRNLYAIPDRLLRLFIVMRERDHQGAYLDTLLRFYCHTRDHQARYQRFEARGDRFARTLRNEFSPVSLDLLAVIHTLVELLGIDEHDPGNRVLAAFLEQPPSGQELDDLLARMDPGNRNVRDPARASAPERAVAHVALAAHFLHRGSCTEAANELVQALRLAPNWSDLAATLSAVRLAGGLTSSHAQAAMPNDSRARMIVDVCARMASESHTGDPDADPGDAPADDPLAQLLAHPDADDSALFSAIAAAIPRRAELADQVLALFDRVLEGDVAGPRFLGVAASYACDVGRPGKALEYLEARHAHEPLPATLDPVCAWLAAMSGQPASYVRAASRLSDKDRAQLRPGMVLALRHMATPDEAFEALAPLFLDTELEPDAVHELFATLLWVRDQVTPEWLVRASRLLSRLTGKEPEPYRWYREFVDHGSDIRSLHNLHPEMREAVDAIRGPASDRDPA